MQTAYGVGLSFLALSQGARAFTRNDGLPLIPDPEGVLDLPEGFSYRLVAAAGETMSDGFFRPGRFDGMACFPVAGDASKCILTRNHENWPDTEDGSPFGDDDSLLERLPEGRLYDTRGDGRPFFGGVTTSVYDLQRKRLDRDYLTLVGTTGNCAGGATPWGSWLTCEESAVTPESGAGKYHGFVFEVPASATAPVEPVPLKAMGRFTHEAAAIDPDTDIVYLTEDNMTGLFYRFLPEVRGELSKGGRLQALAIKDRKSADTRNWPRDWGSTGAGGVEVGREYEVEWIDLDDVEAPDGDLAERGSAAGAASFCRGEGMAYGRRDGEDRGAIYFNCTQGGAARTGQVWRHRPGANGGAGTLELVYESQSADTLDLIDNLAFAPWGDLILCEDGLGDQYLRGLTPDGRVYDLARNAHEDRSEFCGACFSPDGSVLFVNIQSPGFTLAIEGPWASLRG